MPPRVRVRHWMAREGVARRAITKLEGKGHRAGTLRYGDHLECATPRMQPGRAWPHPPTITSDVRQLYSLYTIRDANKLNMGLKLVRPCAVL